MRDGERKRIRWLLAKDRCILGFIVRNQKKKIIPGNESQVVKIEGLSSPFLPRAVGKLHLPAFMSLLWGKKKMQCICFPWFAKCKTRAEKKKESKFY